MERFLSVAGVLETLGMDTAAASLSRSTFSWLQLIHAKSLLSVAVGRRQRQLTDAATMTSYLRMRYGLKLLSYVSSATEDYLQAPIGHRLNFVTR